MDAHFTRSARRPSARRRLRLRRAGSGCSGSVRARLHRGGPTSEVGAVAGELRPVSRADLLDLLRDADELTRNLLIFRALQTGVLNKGDAEEVIAQIWIERAADSFWTKIQAEARAA